MKFTSKGNTDQPIISGVLELLSTFPCCSTELKQSKRISCSQRKITLCSRVARQTSKTLPAAGNIARVTGSRPGLSRWSPHKNERSACGRFVSTGDRSASWMPTLWNIFCLWEPFVRVRVKRLVKGPDDKARSAELISPEMCLVPACNVRRQLCLKYPGDLVSKNWILEKGARLGIEGHIWLKGGTDSHAEAPCDFLVYRETFRKGSIIEKQKILKTIKVLYWVLLVPVLNEDSVNLKGDVF